jgi:AcrR family transcriptional regulator
MAGQGKRTPKRGEPPARSRTARRTGRRPGTNPTREQIIDAARETFAAHGFRGATIRAIAHAAEVDPALIHHYFTSKENLFAVTLQFPEHAAPRVLAALRGDPATFGERLSRAYLGLWEDPQTRRQMAIITKSALTSADALARVRPAVMDVLGQIGTTDLGGPDREVRFQVAMGHLLGVACVRHLAQAPPLSELSFDELVARVAPAVQLHLTPD